MLSLFFLTPLSPNTIVEKLNTLVQTRSESKLISYDEKSIDELIQNLWKKIVRRRNIIIGFIKALTVMSNFLTPYLLDILTNNFKILNNEEQVVVSGVGMTISVEQSSWIYSFLLIFNMVVNVFLGIYYQWQMNKLRYEGKTVLQYLIYRKLIEAKPKESSSKEEDAEANINNLISADCDTFLNLFDNFHQAWSALVCLIVTLFVLYLKVKIVYLSLKITNIR